MHDDTYLITKFSESDPDWFIVNDGVMGGLSSSSIDINDGIATFSGKVSLENNGGFASTRMRVDDVPEGFGHLVLQVKGDGKIFHVRLRKGERMDGLSYDYTFQTKEGEWLEVNVALDEVQGTYRGREFQDELGIESAEIGQIGILVGDKQEGEFLLEMREVYLSR